MATIGIYSALPHPTYDDTTLRAVAAESKKLLVAHRANPTEEFAHLPKDKWPPAIARLKPQFVHVSARSVDITIKPFFDGGWGYGYALDKQNLAMLVECWSELAHDVYWHGPC